MGKKIFYIVTIAIILAAIIIAAIVMFKTTDTYNADPFDAISSNTALIVDIKNIESFTVDMASCEIYNNILNIGTNNPQSLLLYFLNDLTIDSLVKSNIFKQKGILTFNVEGKSNIQQLYISNISDDVKYNSFIIQFVEELKKIGTTKSRKYNEIEILEFKDNKTSKKVFISIKNRLFLLSTSSKLMEETINLLSGNKESINNLVEFENIYNTAGINEIANLYINMKKFPNLFFDKVSHEYKSTLSNFKNFSNWTELDLSIYNDRINLNGFSEIEDSTATFVKILDSQYPIEVKSLKILPNTTGLYLAIALNNYSNYDKNLTAYLSKSGLLEKRDKELNNIKNETGIDIKSVFYSMIESEICYAEIINKKKGHKENSFVMFDIKSRSNIEQELNNIIKSISNKQNKPIESYKSDIKIDDKTSVNCFILPFENLPELLFGPMFKNCSGKYICLTGDFVLIGDSKESLKDIIHNAMLNNTLSTSIEHYSFLEHFSEKSNMFFYFSFNRGTEIFNDILNDSMKNIVNLNLEYVHSLGNLGYQINKSSDRIYNNIVIKQSAKGVKKTQTIWESRLDTLAAIKPAVVINHDDNSKEILVQDEQNNLYLLSKSGRELWKIKLDEKITSKIYQVDFYKNNKLQYLFSTKSKLHIIDRLGNYIEKYPLKLRSKSTAPMALFDYENNKNYRIAIPCDDGKVYIYDKDGNLLKGWDFAGTENIVKNEVSHYIIKKEDFIVLNDDYKAYFLSRKGENKINISTKFKFSANNKIWLDNSSKTTRFVATDENGIVRFFYTDGKQDSLKIKQFSPEHYFTLKDIDSDSKEDFIFVDKNKIEVYNDNKRLIMSYEFDSDISYEPSFYSFSNSKEKIGVICNEERMIYLLNSDGSIFDGFPLYGITPFSISKFNDNENNFNLIVGGLDNLLYNYEIQN